MTSIFARLFLRFLLPGSVLLAIAAPSFAAPQVVAVLLTGGLPHYRQAHQAFSTVLENGGLGADKIKLFVQSPNADTMSLANAVRRSVSAGAKMIVAYGAPAALAAKKEAGAVPVLFVHVSDPVALGLVKSLAAPGAEVTGASSAVDIAPLLAAMQELKPIKRLGLLFTAADQGSVLQAKEVEAAAGRLGIGVKRQEVGAADRLAAVEEALTQVDVLYLTEGSPICLAGGEIVEKARGKGVPVLSQIPGLGEKGALLSLEADPEEQGKLVAVHALQILAGQRALMLPVRQAKKISLTVNRSAARHLSLPLPAPLLGRVDRVID